MDAHVRPMFDGPVDFVGDVHGELEALELLLQNLGYARDGSHPDGRRLVFLGDLVDRGPDSLGVVRRVRGLMEAGVAQCIVGNHELNLLLGKRRAGNEWFYGLEQRLRLGKSEAGSGPVIPQRRVGHRERTELLLFIQRLPLALEREDVRAVHACWSGERVEELRGERRGLADFFYARERELTDAYKERMRAEGRPVPEGPLRHERDVWLDTERQNRNPVTALTSGLERPAEEPFKAGGQLRFVRRVRWWNEYDEAPAVVFGHYWRALDEAHKPVKRGPYLFEGLDWREPLGPRRNCWCLDLGAGARNVARTRGDEGTHVRTALVALRWPERVLVDDHGQVWEDQRA